VLEGAGIDAAIDPAAATAGHGDGDVHFSLATADGRSALGSTFLPAEPDAAAYEPRLRALGASYVPAIAAAPARSRRVCCRPLALDGRPLVGAMPGVEGLFVAAGHGPWGLSTGTASGRHIAGVVLGRADAIPETVRAAVDPARFEAPPG
jgi:glycine/D-amino acid oxidase-like deaminating enzyme